MGVLQWVFGLTVRSVTLGGGKLGDLSFVGSLYQRRNETLDNSLTIHSLCQEVKPQVPRLRSEQRSDAVSLLVLPQNRR
jgi:hypothetical protein